MTKPVKKIIANLKANEVSLVDAGANLQPRFSITKAKESSMTVNINELADLKVDGEESVVDATQPEENQTFAKQIYRICANGSDLLSAATVDAIAKAFGTPQEIQEPSMDAEEIKKAKDELAVELNKAKEDLTKATQRIETLEAQGAVSLWTSKVEKQLANYPGKSTEELVAKFVRLAALDAELANEQFAECEVVAKALTEGNLLKAIGSSEEPSTTDPMTKLNSMASEIQKSDTTLTIEQAFDKATQTEAGRALAKAASEGGK